jgi:sarcosine oxidase subunit gamma
VSAAANLGRADPVAIADLTALPRVAYRGAGAAAWLASHGMALPERHGAALRQPSGAIAVRLAPASFLVLAARDGTGPCAGLEDAYTAECPAACYDLPVRDSLGWLALTGGSAAAFLARFCSLDLRERAFPDGSAAQTHVAKLSATLVRADEGGTPTYHLLTDAASAEWLSGVLGGGR